jgi:hypothetical protein
MRRRPQPETQTLKRENPFRSISTQHFRHGSEQGSWVSSIKLVWWEFFFLGPLMAVNKQCSKLQGLFTGFFPSLFSSDYTSGPTAE